MADLNVRGVNAIPSGRLVVDMADKLAELDPNAAPLAVLLTKLKRTRTVDNPEFSWQEDRLGARADVVTVAALATDTNLTVANSAYFTAGDLVKIPRTGEVMRVLIVGTGTITVSRGTGTTAPAAINANEPILIIGSASAEGSGARGINVRNVDVVSNYTQIFKSTVGSTGTAQATATYGPSDLAWQRKKIGVQHIVDMERNFLFGEKSLSYENGKPLRTTGGILSYLNTNVLDAGGSLTESEFEGFMETVFAKGKKTKFLFGAPRLMTTINTWAGGKMLVVPSDKTYGVAISQYQSFHGTLYLVNHPLFEGSVYGGMGVVLDLDNVAKTILRGRDTKLVTGIQAPDEDATVDQYLTEAGVEVKLPETHGIIKNVG